MKKVLFSVLLLAGVVATEIYAQSNPNCDKKCCKSTCDKTEASAKAEDKDCQTSCTKTAAKNKKATKTKTESVALAKLK
ncbi:MAG: hypothetical protein ACK41O_07205 [Runella zeae]